MSDDDVDKILLILYAGCDDYSWQARLKAIAKILDWTEVRVTEAFQRAKELGFVAVSE